MKKFAILSILILSGFCFSQSSFAEAGSDSIVAQVGNKKISLDEFNKKYSEVRYQSVNAPTKAQFLEDLVRFEVGVQEAEKRNLEKDPAYQEKIRQELYKALLEKDLGEKVQKIQVTEKEIEEYYKKNPELKTSHILIEVKPGATAEQRAEAKKRASEILDDVKSSKRPFEELVKLYSDDTISKQTAGDVGWQSRISLVPAYYDAALSMKVGEVRGLIDTQFGYHIIKLTGRRAFERANKRQLRAAVFDEKRRVVFNQFFDQVKKSYQIKTNPKLIE